MTVYTCAVADCSSNSRNRKTKRKIKGWARFPPPIKEPKRRRMWEIRCRRPSDWKANKYSAICSLHFIQWTKSGPAAAYPDPLLFAYNDWGKNCFAKLNRPENTLQRCSDVQNEVCGEPASCEQLSTSTTTGPGRVLHELCREMVPCDEPSTSTPADGNASNRTQCRLKKTAAPSQLSWTQPLSVAVQARRESAARESYTLQSDPVARNTLPHQRMPRQWQNGPSTQRPRPELFECNSLGENIGASWHHAGTVTARCSTGQKSTPTMLDHRQQAQQSHPIADELCIALEERREGLVGSMYKELAHSSSPADHTYSCTSRESHEADCGPGNIWMQATVSHDPATTEEVGSTVEVTAASFPAYLKKIIDERRFSPKQVFNIEETGLYWKKLPTTTYIFKQEKCTLGFKASKDRLILALGGNAEGDVKLKPLLVYSSENPRALKNTQKSSLPVYWKTSKEACVTTSIFYDYILNYFSPFISRYTSSHNLANKALLIVGNSPAHPHAMVNWCDNVQVVFLPPHTTSLLQPGSQGLIAAFRCYYHRRVLRALVQSRQDGNFDGPTEFWKTFDIRTGLKMINTAWREVTPVILNAVWRKLWPEAVHDISGVAVPDRVTLVKEIAQLANEACLGDVGEEVSVTDAEELLDAHSQELSTEELLELQETRNDEAEPEFPGQPSLTTAKLDEVLSAFDHALDLVLQYDPQADRCFKVRRVVRNGVRCYEELLRS